MQAEKERIEKQEENFSETPPSTSFAKKFLSLLKQEKKWLMIPLIISALALITILALALFTGPLGPFVYTFF